MNIAKVARCFCALQVSQRAPSFYKPVAAVQPLVLSSQPVREKNRRSRHRKKHYDIKFAKLRGEKVFKMELPDYDQMKKDQSKPPDERRADMKKDGTLPPRTFQERPINISSSSDVFEPYIPPEGDGKASFISKAGASQKLTEYGKKGKSLMEVRKIRQYDENFSAADFADQALNIYKEVHELLQDIKENEMRIHDLVTERAYPEMTHALDKKTFRWCYVESIEAPRVVHIRTNDMLTKGNVYGQVTVRIHTKQTLAIYDRFGRLMYGGENIVKDVLEYVVFERHLANEYGIWRIHAKVVPDWMPPRQPAIRTYRDETPLVETEDQSEESLQVMHSDTNQSSQAATV